MPIDLTAQFAGIASLVLFVSAYAVVIAEEFTHMRKSKPVILVAGLIWALVAWQYADTAQAKLPELWERLLSYVALASTLYPIAISGRRSVYLSLIFGLVGIGLSFLFAPEGRPNSPMPKLAS